MKEKCDSDRELLFPFVVSVRQSNETMILMTGSEGTNNSVTACFSDQEIVDEMTMPSQLLRSKFLLTSQEEDV